MPTCVARGLSGSDRSSAALRAITAAGIVIASARECALRERLVAIVVFRTPGQRKAATAAVAPVVTYYSAGSTWLAVPVGDSAPSGQLSAVQDVAAALGGLVKRGSAAS